MKNFTLEERIARLEKLISQAMYKNEFLGFTEPKYSEEKSWINSLFSKYISLRKALIYNERTKNNKSDSVFYIILNTRNNRYNGISFEISTAGDRNAMYCTCIDTNQNIIAKLKSFNLDTDLNKVAAFILEQLDSNKTNNVSNNNINEKYINESVAFNAIECEYIRDLIDENLPDILSDTKIKLDKKDTDKGILIVHLTIKDDITSYTITAVDADKFYLEYNNKKIKTVKSITDIVNALVNHFTKIYI